MVAVARAADSETSTREVVSVAHTRKKTKWTRHRPEDRRHSGQLR